MKQQCVSHAFLHRLLVILAAVLLSSSLPMRAQEIAVDVTDIEDAKDSDSDATAKVDEDEPAEEEEAKPITQEAIRKLIRQRDLDEAEERLEAAIAVADEDDSIHDLRDTLAQALLVQRKYDRSFDQLKASFEHRIGHADNPKNQARLTMTVSLLRMAALRTGRAGVADEAIDRAIEAIDENDLGEVTIQAMATLIPQKAMQLSVRGDREGARELLQQRIDRIDSLDAGGPIKEALVAAKSRLLYAMSTFPDADGEAFFDIVDEYISGAVNEFPNSRQVLSEFARIQFILIARTYRDQPEAAQERLDGAMEVLNKAVEDHPNLKVYLARIKSYQSRIESAQRLQEMVGQEAPPLDIEAWINQGELTQQSLEGKVVLIDFWAVWCGPCIATFPHLRQWHDEFHDQGFEIVGVTRHYGYRWDDESKRAKKSKEDVSAGEENETLEEFVRHHDLRHPTIVTPEGSTMQKEYGVTGIPHAVLIDRKGMVQMIKVGSSESNTEELRAKIAELIAQ